MGALEGTQLLTDQDSGVDDGGTAGAGGQRRVPLVNLRLGHRRGEAVEHDAYGDAGPSEAGTHGLETEAPGTTAIALDPTDTDPNLAGRLTARLHR